MDDAVFGLKGNRERNIDIMSAYLDASNGPPADDSMPSYEEAVAGG